MAVQQCTVYKYFPDMLWQCLQAGINSAHLQCLYASSPPQTQRRGPSRQKSVATPFLGLIRRGLHSQPTTTSGRGSGSHQSLGPAHLPSRSHPLPGPGIGLLSELAAAAGFPVSSALGSLSPQGEHKFLQSKTPALGTFGSLHCFYSQHF